jgi:hypothetical protein
LVAAEIRYGLIRSASLTTPAGPHSSGCFRRRRTGTKITGSAASERLPPSCPSPSHTVCGRKEEDCPSGPIAVIEATGSRWSAICRRSSPPSSQATADWRAVIEPLQIGLD